MGYETALLRRWSRRDRLAVLLVAITVAFLVGTTLVLFATGDAATTIAAEYDAVGDVERYDDFDRARAAADSPDAVVIPIAEVSEGPVDVVAGLDVAADRQGWLSDLPLSNPAEGYVAVPSPVAGSATFTGDGGTVTRPVTDRSGTFLPPTWGVADRSTVDALGPDGALVISPTPAAGSGGASTPLRGALEFFRGGSEQVFGAVAVVAAGVALLVAVVIFGVVRMTARDRRRTVFVVRATGGTRRRILGVFALRGGLLAAVGVALGYAIGVVATHAAVNVAVVAGLPTSLSARLTPTGALLLGAGAVVIVALGSVAGLIAARPIAARLADGPGGTTARAPDATEATSSGPVDRLSGLLTPQLLSARSLGPMVAALVTFAAIALLVVAGSSAAAPLAEDGATVVEPGAIHPIASTVPVAYADAIEDSGTAASPEILSFAVVEGDPVIVRGAEFDRFAAVSDAELRRGRAPSTADEALVGADLARTADLDVGDTVTVGGSTQPAVASVEVVGTFEAPGPYDDALLVSPETARHLTGVPEGAVQFVRTGGDGDHAGVDDGERAEGPILIGADVPRRAPRSDAVSVTATVANPASSAVEQSVTLTVDGEVVAERPVEVAPLATTQVRFEHPFATAGERTVSVGAGNRTLEGTVEVVPRGAPRLQYLPSTVPVGSEPQVRVRSVSGNPIANASVTVQNRTYETAADGTVRLAFPESGERTVTVAAGNRTVERSVTVVAGGNRTVSGSISVTPRTTGVLTRPTARATLANPWNVSRSANVSIVAGEANDPVVDRSVTLEPGARSTVTERLDRRGPGTYPVTLSVDGEPVGTTNVTVERDDRLTSALASTDATVSGSGLGAGAATAFGNLAVLAGTLLGLAAVLAVGSVAFVLASAVDGRERTLGVHRATGAGPREVARLIVGDALRLGLVATPVAIAGALLGLLVLDRLDWLVAFGIRLDPVPSPGALLGLAAGALVVVLASALLVSLVVIRRQPAGLLARGAGVADRHSVREIDGDGGGDGT